jgi:hypothetical protein
MANFWSAPLASPFLAQPNQPLLSSFLPHGFLGAQQPAGRDPGAAPGEQAGRWTSEEHSKFLVALEDTVSSNSADGNAWAVIAQAVGRSESDVKRHAQQYFLKLEHERSVPEENIVSVQVCCCSARGLLAHLALLSCECSAGGTRAARGRPRLVCILRALASALR